MYSIEDRSQVITIGGVEHKLILTTKATKDITKRYGGLEKLGDKLLKNATMEESLGEVIWLIALLANQESPKRRIDIIRKAMKLFSFFCNVGFS